MSGPIFDAHFHVIDPRFPLIENQGYLPPPFTVDDYLAAVDGLDVRGGAVVSASFQGDDQSYLLDALERLGPGFVGVTQLPAAAGDEAIDRLAGRAVRAVRLNLRRGGAAMLDGFDDLAWRGFERAGWHVEVYVEAQDLGTLRPWLASLPKVVIDHLGLSEGCLPDLLRLVAGGASVKASGFGRYDGNVSAALRAITAESPEALVVGTDLPSTRAPRPFSPDDLTTLVDTLGEQVARRVLWDNPRRLYRTFS